MSESWRDAPIVGEDQPDDWRNAPVLDEAGMPPPAKSKSEATFKDLTFGGALKAGAAALGGMADMGFRGAVGVAGTIAGMYPGGESPNEKANRWLEATPQIGYMPKSPGAQAGLELLGKAGEMGIDAAKYVGSGYAGLGAMAAGGGVDDAQMARENFMQTPNALGEGTFQATKSPLMATIAQLLPEVAASVLTPSKATGAVRRARPTPSRPIAPNMPPSGFGGVGPIETPSPRAAPQAELSGVIDELRVAVQRGDRGRVMELINANPAIVAAFEELGIEFTPGMVSERMPIRQTEAALGSMADSNIPTIHKGVQTELTERARSLIDESGGDVDSPSTTAENISTRMDDLHTEYLNREEAIWDDLNRQIPRGAEIDMESAAKQLVEQAQILGKGNIEVGLTRMSKHERELFNLTHRKVQRSRQVEGPDGNPVDELMDPEWMYEPPPWEAIDRFRRRVGMGLNKQGPFNDAEIGELKRWYEITAEQQGRFAKGQGYGDQWEQMNAFTQERKALEKAMQRSTGVGSFNQSTLTKLKAATNSLIRDADPKKWDQFFDDIPADQHQAAAAQALQYVFFAGGKGTEMTGSFPAVFAKIKKDPQLRGRLLDPLPPEAVSTFMAIGEAATGFYRMMDRALSNPSGTAGTSYVLKKLQEPAFMARILGGGADVASGRIPVISDWVKIALRRTPDQQSAQAATRLNAAANMLTDPALRRAIVEYARGNIDRANKILNDAKSWGEWVRTQPLPMQERLRAAGIVALFEEETE